MFFYDLCLGFIICMFSIFVYRYASYYLNDKRYQKLFFSLLLMGMTGLLLFFARSDVSLVFLDIPIILGYSKNHENDSIILSILLIILLTLSTSISLVVLSIKYLVYLISYLYLSKGRKRIVDVLIVEKAFFLSLICFDIYFNNTLLLFLYLFTTILFIYLLIKLIITFINLKNNDYSHNKLESDKKVFRITHEIKNPISVCKGYLDMLDVNQKDKIEKYIPIIKSEMNRALVIMDDFLSLSNISIRSEILDIYLLIEDINETMKKILEDKKVILEIPKYIDELYIFGDYDRLKQVFINLIKNAYEANANHIKIETYVDVKNVKVKIIDNGDGINDKDLKRIGEIFFTTKSNGSGIGVNLSKEIVSLHNGEIIYSSKVSEGTIVTVILPIEKGIN